MGRLILIFMVIFSSALVSAEPRTVSVTGTIGPIEGVVAGQGPRAGDQITITFTADSTLKPVFELEYEDNGFYFYAPSNGGAFRMTYKEQEFSWPETNAEWVDDFESHGGIEDRLVMKGRPSGPFEINGYAFDSIVVEYRALSFDGSDPTLLERDSAGAPIFLPDESALQSMTVLLAQSCEDDPRNDLCQNVIRMEVNPNPVQAAQLALTVRHTWINYRRYDENGAETTVFNGPAIEKGFVKADLEIDLSATLTEVYSDGNLGYRSGLLGGTINHPLLSDPVIMGYGLVQTERNNVEAGPYRDQINSWHRLAQKQIVQLPGDYPALEADLIVVQVSQQSPTTDPDLLAGRALSNLTEFTLDESGGRIEAHIAMIEHDEDGKPIGELWVAGEYLVGPADPAMFEVTTPRDGVGLRECDDNGCEWIFYEQIEDGTFFEAKITLDRNATVQVSESDRSEYRFGLFEGEVYFSDQGVTIELEEGFVRLENGVSHGGDGKQDRIESISRPVSDLIIPVSHEIPALRVDDIAWRLEQYSSVDEPSLIGSADLADFSAPNLDRSSGNIFQIVDFIERNENAPDRILMVLGEVQDDADKDGIVDLLDACPNTIEGNVVDATGCSIAQHCSCDDEWKNHGKFVSCTSSVAEIFVSEGLLSEEEKDVVLSEAAQSACGKPEKRGRPEKSKKPVKG